MEEAAGVLLTGISIASALSALSALSFCVAICWKVDEIYQFQAEYRLDEVVIEAGFERAVALLLLVVSADRDQAHGRWALAQSLASS